MAKSKSEDSIPPEKPEKKKTRTKSVRPKSLSSSNVHTEPVMSEEDRNIVRATISEALKTYQEKIEKKQFSERDLQHLHNIVGEYLKTYTIIGFNHNNEKVFVFSVNNQLEKDALLEHFRSTFINVMQRNMPRQYEDVDEDDEE